MKNVVVHYHYWFWQVWYHGKYPGQANYAAAAEPDRFSKSLAREVASLVLLSMLAPGFIETDMTRALSTSACGLALGRYAGRSAALRKSLQCGCDTTLTKRVTSLVVRLCVNGGILHGLITIEKYLRY